MSSSSLVGFVLVLSLLSLTPTNADNCPKLTSNHSCRCLDVINPADRVRQLRCDHFRNASNLKEALDVVRGQSFYTIDINQGSLTPYIPGLFKNIECLSLELNQVTVDSSLKLDEESELLESVNSLTLRSVRGLDLVDWDTAFAGFWSLFVFHVESSPFSTIPMSAHTIGAFGSYLEIFEVSQSEVKCLDDLSLSTLTEVKIIDLSRNKLTRIRRESLPICKFVNNSKESCLKLESLDLSFNELSFVPENLLQDFSELNKIFLIGNRLSTLGRGLVDSLPPIKHSLIVDVYDNPIVCECESMQWILTNRKNIRLYGTCRGYPNYSMREVLRDLVHCRVPIN